MKKILKKLIALTLSLVMIFGTIPCFTNIVSATGASVEIDFSGISTNINDYKLEDEIPLIGVPEPPQDDEVFASAIYDKDGNEVVDKFTKYGEYYAYLEMSNFNELDFDSFTFGGEELTLSNTPVSNIDKDTKKYYNDKDNQRVYAYLGFKICPPPIYVDYTKQTSYDEFINFNVNNVTVTTSGGVTCNKYSDKEALYDLYSNPDFLGYFLYIIELEFESSEERDAIEKVYLRDIDLGKPTLTTDEVIPIALTLDSVLAIDEDESIYVIEKLDFSKSFNITASFNENTKVKDAIDSVTDNLTAAGIDRKYYISETPDFDPVLSDDDILESGKTYYFKAEISNVEDSVFYNNVTVNNDNIPNPYHVDEAKPYTLVSTSFDRRDLEDCYFVLMYEFTPLAQTSGSKKYKAVDTKDTTEKISGSGKKGSTRTIVPQEGRKVTSVVVTDKDGNKVDVTLNKDGTYSFVQPASNVDVQVNYKNRKITLNIGSTEASVDDEKTNLDVCPVIRNDRTMLPIRFVAENLGAKVEWNELEPNMVYITRGDIKIEIKLGSNIAKVNGKEYELDSVAFAENDRTYMPVRFVSEALNAIVEWNESKPNEVKIYEQ